MYSCVPCEVLRQCSATNPADCERSEPVTRVGWRISLVYIYILLLLLLLLIIEHTTEGAEYYLVWGGDVEWGMNGRGGGGGGGDSSGSCNCSQHLLYVRLSASDIKRTHR